MLPTLLAGLLLGPPSFDFYANGPYESFVPRPETLLGYRAGDRHTTFRDQERVFALICESANAKVRMFQYGKSVEGRPLRIYAISSAKNISHLAEHIAKHQELAQGKGDPSKTIPFVWINECIHGDETASAESAMWTFYNLAAAKSGSLAKALDDVVVILNPVYNPDGHERYVVYYNSIATGSSAAGSFEQFQPSVIYGRTNHYRFDMNRDRVAFSQDETRQEYAELLKWNPQVYIDQHGQVSSYFFPPEPMSVNPNVDRARNAKWTEYFGRETGKAFDASGFSYYVKDEFDLYYPGYLDSSTTLTGAIGMTHETDGGRVIAQERGDGSILTLKRGIEKHFTSALAVVKATAQRSTEILSDYATFKKRTVSGESAGKFKRVVVSGDRRALGRLKSQLSFAGIQSDFAAGNFKEAVAHDYWTDKTGAVTFHEGDLVIDVSQPQGAMAKALLEPITEFEPEFKKAQIEKKKSAPEGETYPGPDQPEFYDLTGWSLPYAHNLRAWWCESATPIQPSKPSQIDSFPDKTSVGFLVPYTDQEDILFAADALSSGLRVQLSSEPMKLAGKSYDVGGFLILADRQEEDYLDALRKVIRRHKVNVLPLGSSYPDEDRTGPGSGSTMLLRKPKIGVVMGSGTNLADCGAIWYLMDRVFQLPFTPLSSDSLSRINLDEYTCLVFPGGASGPTAKLKEWVGNGNVLVALDGIGWTLGSTGFVDLTEAGGKPASLPGALFRAEIDSRSFLSFGYPQNEKGKVEISVPIQGSRFYKARKEGGSVVALSSDEKSNKLLSGWEWPDDTEKNLAGTTWLQDAPYGRGHAILFTQDPTDRAMWPGLYKLLLNAMILGSSR